MFPGDILQHFRLNNFSIQSTLNLLSIVNKLLFLETGASDHSSLAYDDEFHSNIIN